MKQMKVNEYAQQFVPKEFIIKFFNLMEQWDGSSTFSSSFYNIDILNMIYKEAQE